MSLHGLLPQVVVVSVTGVRKKSTPLCSYLLHDFQGYFPMASAWLQLPTLHYFLPHQLAQPPRTTDNDLDWDSV